MSFGKKMCFGKGFRFGSFFAIIKSGYNYRGVTLVKRRKKLKIAIFKIDGK